MVNCRLRTVSVGFLSSAIVAATFVLPAAAQSENQQTLPSDWVEGLRWRTIGPANMGGRITDIAVYEADPSLFWVASASGGLLKTVNNGVSFTHQFDTETTVSIGDIDVSQTDPNIIWVGTGEANPRNSVSWGNGVYKSTDGGETFKHMGLEDSFQISAISIHPENPDIVYVGALGRLWGPNEQRGLFKTTDGGETWQKIHFVNDMTGVIDIRMKPDDPNTLVIATYERQRDMFDSNDPAKKWGPGSGIWRTTDAGATFTRATEGLPTCDLGRIGLDWYRADPNVIYAIIESSRIGEIDEDAAYLGAQGQNADVGARLTEIASDSPAEEAGMQVGDIVIRIDDQTVQSSDDMEKAIRRHAAGETVQFEVSRNREAVSFDVTFAKQPSQREDAPRGGGGGARPYSASLGGQRENVQDLQGPEGFEYGGVYRSDDAGISWTRINSVNPRPMYYSEIRVDPSDDTYMWVLGTSLYRSSDGGVTFTGDGARGGVHVDHHAMWINPNDGRHVLLGNDGGFYVTHDRGEIWEHENKFTVSQFYHVGVDSTRDYKVYGGLQDNGSWGGPNMVRNDSGPVNEDWFSVGGGDGFICLVDPEDPDLVYFESQNGATGRRNFRTGDRASIRPRAPRGERYRFNWRTPFILSNHNPKIYYSAGNHVFKSLNKGDNIAAISPEITNTNRGSATALAESPRDPDLLYVGTDDGAVWKTEDGGDSWTKLLGELVVDEPEAADDDDAEVRTVARDTNGANGSTNGSVATDAVSGQWNGTINAGGRGANEFTLTLALSDSGELTGRVKTQRGEGDISDATYDADAGRVAFKYNNGRMTLSFDGTVDGNEMTGKITTAGFDLEMTFTASRIAGEQQEMQVQQQSTTGESAGRDAISGKWNGEVTAEEAAGQGGFELDLKLDAQGAVTGSFDSQMGGGPISNGKFESQSGKLTFDYSSDEFTLVVTATVSGSTMTGTMSVAGMDFSMPFEASRAAAQAEVAEGQSGARERTRQRDPSARAQSTGGDAVPLPDLVDKPMYISGLEPSRFETDRVYLSIDGHRSNDDLPHVFVSEDRGSTWRSIRSNLPDSAGSVRVIREDIVSSNVLYIGTEFGAWISVDRGGSWTSLNTNLPTVAVHEIAQHPLSGEIIAGTHGRGIWIADMTPFRQLSPETISARAHLYRPNTGVYWDSTARRGNTLRRFVGENPSGDAEICYSLSRPSNSVSLKVYDVNGNEVISLPADGSAGMHIVRWDMREAAREVEGRGGRRFMRAGPRLSPGSYRVVLTVGNESMSEILEITGDPAAPHTILWGEEYDERLELEELFHKGDEDEHDED